MICNWSLVLASLPAPKILLSATSGDILKYLTWKERERGELRPGWGGGGNSAYQRGGDAHRKF